MPRTSWVGFGVGNGHRRWFRAAVPARQVSISSLQRSTERVKFEAIIADAGARTALLSALTRGMEHNNDNDHTTLVRVRFCIAVDSSTRCLDARERLQRLRKIYSLFIVHGGMFELDDVPDELASGLALGKLDLFIPLREYYADKLCVDPSVLRFGGAELLL